MAKDLLMHARILLNAHALDVHYPASLSALLTPSMKKNCFELLKFMGFEQSVVNFIEYEVQDTPLELEQIHLKRQEQHNQRELLKQPMARFLVEQPGYKLKS